MGCHFGGDQVENSLRAALIRAVKDLCVGKQNKSKGDKKTELIATALSVSFLSFCLCQKVPKYLSTVGVTPRSVGIGC